MDNSSPFNDVRELLTLLAGPRATRSAANVVPSIAALIFLRWAEFQEQEREAIAAFDGVSYAPALPDELRWTRLEKHASQERPELFAKRLLAAVHTPSGEVTDNRLSSGWTGFPRSYLNCASLILKKCSNWFRLCHALRLTSPKPARIHLRY